MYKTFIFLYIIENRREQGPFPLLIHGFSSILKVFPCTSHVLFIFHVTLSLSLDIKVLNLSFLVFLVYFWIQCLHLRISCLRVSFFFFFFLCTRFTVSEDIEHCSRDPHSLYSKKIYIKNGFHSTIHTFKNYFATMFSVFSKINCI